MGNANRCEYFRRPLTFFLLWDPPPPPPPPPHPLVPSLLRPSPAATSTLQVSLGLTQPAASQHLLESDLTLLQFSTSTPIPRSESSPHSLLGQEEHSWNPDCIIIFESIISYLTCKDKYKSLSVVSTQ